MSGRRVLCCHPSAELYGSDRVFAESVGALVDAGWQVTVTVPEHGPLVDLLQRADVTVRLCPVAVLRKSALRPKGLLRLLFDGLRTAVPMARLLRQTAPELIYISTVTVPSWLVLARLLRWRRIAVVAHVHEAEDTVPAPIRVGLSAPLLAADAVLVNSQATSQSVRRAVPALDRRIKLLYNGVAGPPHPMPPRSELDYPVRVTLIGRLSPRKGIDVAIEAIGQLAARRAVTLDVFGSVFPGYEWYENDLRHRIEELGLRQVIRLHGFSDNVWNRYAVSDIAIVPSRVEPFGNTAVEAQLAGVPVIVTDVQGLPETVDGGRLGAIVASDSPAELATALTTLIDNWPAANTTAELARTVAESRFSCANYRALIVEMLTDTLAGKSPR